MQEIGRGGRTILFVSHNMSAIRSISNRGVVLDKGRFIAEGEINQVVDYYLSQANQESSNQKHLETESFIVNNVQIYSINSTVIKTFDPVEIRVLFTAKTDIRDPGLYIGFLTADQHRLAGLDFKDFTTVPAILAGETGELGFLIDSLPLLPGGYLLDIHLKDMAAHKYEFVPYNFPFEVVETPVYGGRKTDSWFGHLGFRAWAKNYSSLPMVSESQAD
jgi:lipopolysaccharide transport system ATP-binding protein